MEEIVIRKEHLEEMTEHCVSARPDEACGLLAGRGRVVERVFRMGNANASPVSYGLEPRQQMRAFGEMEAGGLGLIGIYHSHPVSPPYPSRTDVERAFFPGTGELNYPAAVYVIVGLSGGEPEVKAYRIDEAGGVHSVLITGKDIADRP